MIARRAACLAALAASGLGAAPAPAEEKPRYAAILTRTAQGIAHVTARDMAGLGYGSGYAAAEDNGCVIADTLLTVRGERSRWFGATGRAVVGFNEIPNLESDFFHRAVGDRTQIEAGFAATGRDNRALLDGFAAGYNRFLRDHRDRFAASCRDAEWLRPMRHDDLLLLINGAMVQGSSAPFARAIAAAAPPDRRVVATADIALPGSNEGLGSNGWAFGKDRVVGGRGLLVGNPHFPWEGPNRFRRLHLTIPGKLDVMGAGLVYSPFVAIGFNRDVAWTHTVSTAQHQTLFALTLDPADPTAYQVDGHYEPMARRTVTVEVRDSAPVTRTLYVSRYGPMLVIPAAGLGWSAARGYAIRDADQANLRSGDAWLGIGKARSVLQVRDAIARTLGVPYVNTIAADRAGRVLYADVTAVPNVSLAKLAACSSAQAQRAASQSAPIFILDGTRSSCNWDVDRATPVAGLMPAQRMPALLRSDWVQNSNDTYWLSNPLAPMPAFSPLLGQHAERQNLRTRSAIREIMARLSGNGARIDMAAARDMALANKVFAAELMLDSLLARCATRPTLAHACGVLTRWDRHAETGSRGALLFFYFWRRASNLKDFWAIPYDPWDPVGTPRDLNPDAVPAALDALQAAADEMAAAGIALDAPLGTIQIAPRGSEKIAIHGGPGSAGVLNAMNAAPAAGGLVPVHGTSYLQVVGFAADGPVAESLLAYSQSSDPASPWYADATHAYSEKRWLRMPFTLSEIAATRVGAPLAIAE